MKNKIQSLAIIIQLFKFRTIILFLCYYLLLSIKNICTQYQLVS